MKKFLLSLLTVVLASVAASAVEYTATFTSGKADTSNAAIMTYQASYGDGVEAPDFAFKAEKGSSGSSNPVFNSYPRVYANSTFTISVPEGLTVTKLVFDEKNEKRTAELTANVGTVTWNSTTKTQTWEGSVTGGNIVISIPKTGTIGTDKTKDAQFCFSKVDITAEGSAAPAKKNADLVFASETASGLVGQADFEAPALVNPNGLAVTYTSSNPEVATVNNGTYELLSAGTTIITATSEENDEFKAGEATFTLTVIKPGNPADGVVAAITGGSTGSSSAIYNYTVAYNAANVPTFTFRGEKDASASLNPTYSKSAARVYANSTFTITVPEGYTVTKLVFDEKNTARTAPLTANKGTVTWNSTTETQTWEGSVTGDDIIISVPATGTLGTDKTKAAQFCFSQITIFYEEAQEEIQEPVFPAEGLTFTSEEGDIISEITEEGQEVMAILETENDFAVVNVEIPETFDAIYYVSLEGMYMSSNKAPRKANKYTEEWPSVEELGESMPGLTEGTQIQVPADGEEHGYYVFAGVEGRIYYYMVSLTALAEKVVEPVFPAEGLKFTSEEGEVISAYDEDQEAFIAIATLATYNDSAVINVEIPETFNKIYYTSLDYMYMKSNKAPRKANKFTQDWPSLEDLKGEGGMPYLTEGTQIEVPADGESHAYYVFAGVDEKIFYYPVMLMATATELEPQFPAEGINFTSKHGTLHSFIVDGQQMVAGELETTDAYAVIDIELPIGFNSVHHFDAHYDIDIDDPNDDDAPAYAPKKATRFEGWATSEEMDVELTNDVQIQVPNDGRQHNYYVFLGKNGYIHQSPALVQVRVYNRPTGVDGVEAAEEAEYYTLQGVKVANPEKGFYIKVANGKATRVYVK